MVLCRLLQVARSPASFGIFQGSNVDGMDVIHNLDTRQDMELGDVLGPGGSSTVLLTTDNKVIKQLHTLTPENASEIRCECDRIKALAKTDVGLVPTTPA